MTTTVNCKFIDGNKLENPTIRCPGSLPLLMFLDIQKAIEAKKSVLLLGEQAQYLVILLTAKRPHSICISKAEYFKSHPLTLLDYISSCFYRVSVQMESLLIIDSIDVLCHNDPVAASHILRLVNIHTGGIRILASAKTFEQTKYFDHVYNVPDLMPADDLYHFKVSSTQFSYKDVVKGNVTVGKSLTDSTPDFRKMEWDKVGGLGSVKEKLLAAANSLDSDYRVSGVLLYGPPGTGKTLLARALATKLNWPLLARSIGDLLHSHIGESEKAIEKMFDDAVKLQPCIIFLDELDALFNGGVGMGKRMSAHLSHQFDEMTRRRDKVLVIGATNHVERIDKSLQRIGRFESSIMVGLPNSDDRKSILTALGVPSSVADTILQNTNGMTGAEIAQLVQMARQQMLTSGASELTADMFDKA